MKRLNVMALVGLIALVGLAQARTFRTLYSFTGRHDGGKPEAAMIQDQAGNLYGTTPVGGGFSDGVVFELNTSGTETVLLGFDQNDGTSPIAPLIRDSEGNLYGTAQAGGSGDCDGGCGTVFKLDTAGNETTLHEFAGGTSDGCFPLQGVTMDKDGGLYGTTGFCGNSTYGDGTVFKIDTAGNETILYNFTGADGDRPTGGHLLVDSAGNLYGVTSGGGYAYGVLYKLSKQGTLTVLHSFIGSTSDGCGPYGTVAMDNGGNFYGTTYGCGSSDDGVAWKVSKKGHETILHSFAGGTSDGCYPEAGVVLDSKGNLYGDTVYCGASGQGTVWELSPQGALTLLHSFGFTDGSYPYGEVLRTANGTLYGTTSYGGSYGYYGTVWKYKP
jgi:uncharacterized repeat protein (TIGR03803 family)